MGDQRERDRDARTRIVGGAEGCGSPAVPYSPSVLERAVSFSSGCARAGGAVGRTCYRRRSGPLVHRLARLPGAMYIHRMNRLVRKQVYITEEQEQLLKRAARRERRTEADIFRFALEQVLRPKKIRRNRAERDPLWEIVGLGQTGDGDVARNVDHYLYGAAKR
jgi:hypothetical protein